MRPRCLANSRRFIRKRGRLQRSGLRLAQAGKESTAGCSDFAASAGGWLRQLGRKQAAEDSSGEGCSDLLASVSRALQLEQVESQKRLPRESCGCAGLSPKLHCARLGRSRAWASQAVVARGAALLAKAGEGPTAVTTLSERSALVVAKAA